MRAIIGLAFLAVSTAALAQQPLTGTPYTIGKEFAFAEDGEGVSGMACLAPDANGARECLVVNDEVEYADVGRLNGTVLESAGRKLAIIFDQDKGQDILGTARNPMCKNEKGKMIADGFEELDGEGIALSGDMLYVTGSHSCTGKGKYKASAYVLARVKVASATTIGTSATVERTWRVADMLAASTAGQAYGAKKEVGTNIEGLAVAGDRLFVGLRTPVTDGKAHIVSAPVTALFAAGTAPLDPGIVTSHIVPLGAGVGIRDLAALKDGRLLVLAGPSNEQPEVTFSLWLFNPAGDALKPIGQLAPVKAPDGDTGKAETVTILDEKGKTLRLLILYDNIRNGAPQEVSVTLP